MDNKIKITKAYTYNNENPEKNYLSSFIEYNQNGQITKSVAYFAEDQIESKTITKFNDKGHIIEEINYISEDEITEHHKFENDDEGKIQKITIKYQDGSISEKNLEYFDNDLKIVITTKDEDGYLEEKEIKIFDEKKNLLEHHIFDEDEDLTEKHISKYDENSKLVNKKSYDENNALVEERVLTFDENKFIKETILNPQGKLIDYITLEYDDQDRVIRQKIGNHQVVEYIYNTDNNTIIEERYNANGLAHQSVSKYNDEGLLIEETDVLSTTKYEYEFWDNQE